MAGEIPRYDMQAPSLRQVPRYTPFETIPVSPVDTSVAEGFKEMASTFDLIGNVVDKLHDQRVQQEAEVAGQEAGMAEGFDPNTLPAPTDWTMAGQTFRKAAIESYAVQLDMDFTEKLYKIRSDYEALPFDQRNPVELQTRLAGLMDGMLEGLPAEARQGFAKLSYNKILPVVLDAQKEYFATTRERQEAEKKAGISGKVQEINSYFSNPEPFKSKAEQDAWEKKLHTGAAELAVYIDARDDIGPVEKQALKLYWANQISDASETFKKTQMENYNKQLKLQRETLKASIVQQALDISKTPKEAAQWVLKNGRAKLGISIDDETDIINKLQAIAENQDFAFKMDEASLTWEQKLQVADTKNGIEEKVGAGAVTPAQVDEWGKAHQNIPGVTPEWVANQKALAQKALTKRLDEENELGQFANGTLYVEPGSDKEQKLVDKLYQRLSGQTSGGAWVHPAPSVRKKGQFMEQRPGHKHDGIDYALPAGAAIHAAGPGKVIHASWLGGYGRYVRIQHPDGTITGYAHQSKMLVDVGDKVGPGQVIGYVGNTGHSHGPHLHFNVQKDGQWLDPEAFVRQKPQGTGKPLDPLKFMTQTHRMSTDLVNGMLRLFNSSKPADILNAVTMFDWVERNEVRFSGVDEVTQKRLRMVHAAIQNGQNPVEAKQYVLNATNPQNRNNHDEVGFKAVFITNDKINVDYRQAWGENDGFFGLGSNRATGASYGEAYKKADVAAAELYKGYLKRGWDATGGNKQQTIDFANREIRKAYGPTVIGGGLVRMVKPPETQPEFKIPGLSDAENAQWMREDFRKALQKLSLKPDDQYNLRYDYNSGQYEIWHADSNGIIQPVRVAGKMALWKPDVIAAKKKFGQTAQSGLNAARDSRNKNWGTSVYSMGILP